MVPGCDNQNSWILEFGGVSEVLGKRMVMRFLTLYCLEVQHLRPYTPNSVNGITGLLLGNYIKTSCPCKNLLK
jgi:hypothetical protein